MEDSQGDVRRWADSAWPDHNWSRSELRHGAFHEVLVLPEGPVGRLADGLGHQERMHREAGLMALLERFELPMRLPTALSAPVTTNGRSGVLTSLVPGRTLECRDWASVREGLTETLTALAGVGAAEAAGLLPRPRHWCGGMAWKDLVREHLAPRLPPTARAAANKVVADVLDVERLAAPQHVHGDFGLHNVHWAGAAVSGLIDMDHASWGDPAIDVAPLIGTFGIKQLDEDFEPEVLHRSMYHRATLPLQVAAAAHLAGRAGLRDHALQNFASRLAQETLYDPQRHRPSSSS